MIQDFTCLFQYMIYKKYEDLILDFNEVMKRTFFQEKIYDELNLMKKELQLDEKTYFEFKKSINGEFSIIEIEDPCNKLLEQSTLLAHSLHFVTNMKT